MKKEEYYEIMNYPDHYVVSEIYRRMINDISKEVYEEISEKRFKFSSLKNKAVNVFKTWYFVYFIKGLIAWISLGFIIFTSYMFFHNRVYSYFPDQPDMFLKSLDFTGIPQKVALFVGIVLLIKILRYYRQRKEYDVTPIEFPEMELDKAYQILKADRYDNIDYLKMRMGKIIARNRLEMNRTINAYVTIVQNYPFDDQEEITDKKAASLLFLKNIMVAFLGLYASFLAFVPVFCLFTYIRIIPNVTFNEMAKAEYLRYTHQNLEWIYQFVLKTPFMRYLPFLNGEFGHTYAFCIFIGFIFIFLQLPGFIIECMRQYRRAVSFGKRCAIQKVRIPKVTVYSNNFKNKFNIFRMVLFFYLFVYILFTYIIR